MSRKINLIAKEIKFTFHSIVYIIEPEGDFNVLNLPVYCPNNIDTKELLLKPTILNSKMEVVYGLYNMTPHFYQQILNKRIQNYLELHTELKNIYKVGDVVGCVLL